MKPEELADPLSDERAALPDFALLGRRYPPLAHFAKSLGDTPLIEVPGIDGGSRILAKCEWANPHGSVKDRVAYVLIAQALEHHGDRDLAELKILEYSGGNLARALAHLGAALGLRMKFVLPANASAALLQLLANKGMEVALVDHSRGFVGVIQSALEIRRRDESWTLLYQHRNTLNPAFHARTTGAEIVKQLRGKTPDAWVASIGSGGTLAGVREALVAVNPHIEVVGVTPAEMPYGTTRLPSGAPLYAGAAGLGRGIRQPHVRAVDFNMRQMHVTRNDSLLAMTDFKRLTGIMIGGSAAANWLCAKRVAEERAPDQSVVTLFADSGSEEDWRLALSLARGGVTK